jgi:hypothetical protein
MSQADVIESRMYRLRARARRHGTMLVAERSRSPMLLSIMLKIKSAVKICTLNIEVDKMKASEMEGLT